MTAVMSLLPKPLDAMDKKHFYSGKSVTEVEWWISYACNFPDLYWGRLRVFADGSADAAFDESTTYGFVNRDNAENFLAEDEYTRFATLDHADEELIGARASEMSPPSWRDDAPNFEYLGTR